MQDHGRHRSPEILSLPPRKLSRMHHKKRAPVTSADRSKRIAVRNRKITQQQIGQDFDICPNCEEEIITLMHRCQKGN